MKWKFMLLSSSWCSVYSFTIVVSFALFGSQFFFFFVFVCYKRINGTLHHVFCEHWHYVKLSKTVIGWNGPWAFSTFNNVLMCGNIYFNVSACVITHLQSSWWRAKCQLSVFFLSYSFVWFLKLACVYFFWVDLKSTQRCPVFNSLT